ncbi:phage baseplate assembly protein V [Salmonella enterica]|nr:phage baseplate assembly protein [Salmonella enterica]EGL7479597.1 phage baseplate assembly protein [Salmonella enterica]EIZ2335801.1 phage baseplate assembly protein V [Salmonella enterica]
MPDIQSLLRQMMRRIAMLAGTGRVSAINDDGNIQTVQTVSPGEIRNNTPRLAEFGFSSGLPTGSDVVILFPGGDRSNAVIIASGHQSSRPGGLMPGETMVYDQWGHHIRLTKEGIVLEAAGGNVVVNNAATLEVNATEQVKLNTKKLLVTGDIIDNCGGNPVTMRALREAYNRHDHDIQGVKSGGDSVRSQPTGEQVE